jgi:hypothetical protein
MNGNRFGIERRGIRMKRGAGRRPASLGMVPAQVSLPDWPYDSLDLILFAEAAAAFEEFTLASGPQRTQG